MIERLRSVPPGPEAMAIAGLSLTAAGLAIAADALADAAVPRALGGFDRIVFGLWRLQLAQMLTLTVGLGLLALGLHRGARLGDWREPVGRAGAGIAIGALLVAAAVVLGSTYVALAGHVGDISVTGDSRVFTWLRQLVTAAGFGCVWVLIAARLSRVVAFEYPAVVGAEAEADPAQAPAPEPEAPTLIPEPPLVRVAPSPPPPPPAAAPPRVAPVLPSDISSPAARAQRIYVERLSFSPRAAVARTIVEEVGRLDRDGNREEAERLVRRLQEM